MTLLRAIEQFSRFGRLGETVDLVERATLKSMKQRADEPALGGVPYSGIAPGNSSDVFAVDVGYVEHIDVQRLNAIAEEHQLTIYVTCQPGTFATPNRALLRVGGPLNDDQRAQMVEALTIGGSRTIENDPRYGLVVLAEIGVRSMSPAVNDPGTCITVIGTCVRLLLRWDALACSSESEKVQYPHVYIAQLDVEDLFEDVFAPISTDAAGSLEVNIRLQKALAALCAGRSPATREAAQRHAHLSLERALQTLIFSQDREKLRAIAAVEHQRAQDSAGRQAVAPAN